MAEPFIGDIRMVAFNFAPRGYAMCNGQLLPIAQNPALYSLIGTTYGGDGQQTFGLPNLQSRFPIHLGQGPGLSNNYQMGEMAGVESVTLTSTQIPAHSHAPACNSAAGDQGSPSSNFWAASAQQVYSNAAPNVSMHAGLIQPTGGNQPHNNVSPLLVINFVIALEGVFPSRN
jgi:microcystin-dependent protein